MRGLLLLLVIYGLPALAAVPKSAVDQSFAPHFGWRTGIPARQVFALQEDGKILVGGSFNEVNGTEVPPLVRLNVDGTLDPSFRAPVGVESVGGFYLGLDQKIYLSGRFVFNNRTSTWDRIFYDGSRDTTFCQGIGLPGMGEGAFAALEDGSILVTDDFSSWGGSKPYLARLQPDGSVDRTFQPPTRLDSDLSLHGMTLHLLSHDKFLLAGNVGVTNDGITSFHRFFRDGRLDSSFRVRAGPLFIDLILQTVVLPNESILFTDNQWDGLKRLNADGSWDQSFEQGAPWHHRQAVRFAVAPDQRILCIVSPDVEGPDYRLMRLFRDGSVDTNFDVGSGPADWLPGEDKWISAPAIQNDGQFLMAGNFRSFDGIPCTGLIRVRATLLTCISGYSQDGDLLKIKVVGNVGTAYDLKRSDDLGTWETVAAGVFPQPSIVFKDLIRSKARFYRIQ